MNADTSSLESTQIAEFAAGVRAALADLPPEEVEDLTDGLEADLAESLAEDLRRTLPDPVVYAAELRQAAGLPGRVAGTKAGVLSDLLEAGRRTRDDLTGAIRRNPALESALDFAAELRPAWWIVRAWLATWLVASIVGVLDGYGFNGLFWIVLAVFVLVSVQWGRGRWGFPGLKAVVLVGNLIAIVVLLPVLSAAGSRAADQGYDAGYAEGAGPSVGEFSENGDGLFFHGLPLENIYAYDAAGNPLSGVQLFDVDGKPLVPVRRPDLTSILQAPATLETGTEAYNVYPLKATMVVEGPDGDYVPDPNPDVDKAAGWANGPFLKVPAVQTPVAPTPAPTPTTTVAQPNQ